MSMFEFVLTGFTIVLALVITRVLSGLRWVFAPGRIYWVHAVFVVSLLVATSLVWWSLWYQRDNTWTYLPFAFNLLVGPGIMYFLAVLLIPEQPRRIGNWRTYFFSIRNLLYGSLALMVIAAFIGAIAINGTPLWHPTQFIMAGVLGLALTGWRAKTHTTHAVLAVTLGGLVLAAAVLAARSPTA